MTSKFAWFATNRGRDCVRIAVMGMGFIASAAAAAPNTFLLEKYKDFLAMYRNGFPVAINTKVQSLYEEVLKDMKINEVQKELITPFTVYGFEMFHGGCVETRPGSYIGIPTNFTYESPRDVDRNIQVVEKDIDWESEMGNQLQEALVLSDKAKKFAIAREVAQVTTFYPAFYAMYPAVAINFTAYLASVINKKLQMFNRPPLARIIMYNSLALFGFGLYFFAVDFTTVTYDHYVDDVATDINSDYLDGGIEFYDKLLKRNILLRNLMGNKGKDIYSVNGNENVFIRQKTIPLVHRKLYLEDKLKNLKAGGEPLDSRKYVFGDFSETETEKTEKN